MADLVAKIKGDASHFDKTMKGLVGTSQHVGMGISKGLMGGVGLAGGLSAAVYYMADLVNELDNIDDSARKAGVSTDFFQKMAFTAKLAGVEVGSVMMGFKKIRELGSKAAGGDLESNIMLDKMGVSIEELMALDPEGRFKKITAAMMDMKDPIEQDNAAMKIFAKGWTEILPVLKDFDGVAKMMQERGLIIDPKNINAARDIADSFERMKLSLKTMSISTDFMGGLKEVFDIVEKTAQGKGVVASGFDMAKSTPMGQAATLGWDNMTTVMSKVLMVLDERLPGGSSTGEPVK